MTAQTIRTVSISLSLLYPVWLLTTRFMSTELRSYFTGDAFLPVENLFAPVSELNVLHHRQQFA